MANNPYAEVFREAFYKDVLDTAIYTKTDISPKPQRVTNFMNNLNSFLRISGVKPILYQNYSFDEHKLFEYALFLRGYMRDAQSVLVNLKQEQATDVNLIDLFSSASQYIVACNNQLKDKRRFNNDVDYRIWKMDMKDGLENASYAPVTEKISTEKQNLFLIMPFRIKDDEQQLNKWLSHNMRDTLNNRDIFAKQVDSYVVHYPIQKSRSSNILSVLKTLRYANDYIEPQDVTLVKNHLLHFIGKDIQIDNNGNLLSGEAYSPEQFKSNMQKITMVTYCAATVIAHRAVTLLHKVASQLYGKETSKEAMSNIFISSYGFLPVQKNNLYSGVHFFSHKVDDKNKKEPFVNLNNHELYEQTKCTDKSNPARISVMPDGRNYVVAFNLPEKLILLQNGQFQEYSDAEYGHSMLNINSINVADENNYSYNLFKSVLENSSLGYRGISVMNIERCQHNINNTLTNYALLGRMQRIH